MREIGLEILRIFKIIFVVRKMNFYINNNKHATVAFMGLARMKNVNKLHIHQIIKDE